MKKLSAVLLLCIAGLGALWKLHVIDLQADIHQRRAQLLELRSETARSITEGKRLVHARQQVNELERRVEALEKALPVQADMAATVRGISATAIEANVAIERLNPQSSKSHALYSELGYKVQGEGTYQSVTAFFDKIQRITPIVRISDFTLRATHEHGEEPSLTVDVVLTTFVLHERKLAGPIAATAVRQAPPDATSSHEHGTIDPFGSRHLRESIQAAASRPAGLAGVLVSEITLKGIMKIGDAFVAMLETPGKRTYTAVAGEKLFDGAVTAVTGGAITLSHVAGDANGRGRPVEITKRLRPEGRSE